jgi:hypothetical protein
VTEGEWLTGTNPRDMLGPFWEGIHDRKLRLFAVAACRQTWHLLTDERSRQAVEAAEVVADGGDKPEDDNMDLDELAEIAAAEMEEESLAWYAALAARWSVYTGFRYSVIEVVQNKVVYELLGGWRGVQEVVAPPLMAELLRDIFGNPFRPVALNAAWLSWADATVPRLAQVIYDERAFDHLPILADALEDTGCTDTTILDHCHGPGPHVRGCWVVDLILGKS